MELDKYIEYLRNRISNMSLSEVELIMYIYIDLGYRLKYDDDFYLSTHKKQKYLYNHSSSDLDINWAFNDGTINCKSVAYILKYVLSRFDVDIDVLVDKDDYREFKHVYNVIKPRNGSTEYTIDLQDDMINIYFRGMMKSFGRSLDDNSYVVGLEEQKKIHLKIDYISKTDIYTDEYIDMLKMYSDMYDNFYERLDFVLSNIDPLEVINNNYWERRWRHDRILRRLFKFEDLFRKLHIIEFYHNDNEGKKSFTNGFYVHNKDGVFVYYYEDNRYNKYSVRDFALKVIEEDIKYRQNVQGLNSRVKNYKYMKKTME